MSHVISAQPSATSPYQPTAMQEGAKDNTPRIHRIDSEQGQDDCCIHTRGRKGCCLFWCTLLSMCCQSIKNCTERCCDCCANCLIDCCEDKPRERTQRIYNNRYKSSGGVYYDNSDDNDWGLTSLAVSSVHAGASEPNEGLMTNASDAYNDSGLKTHHSSVHQDSGNHNSNSHHDSGNNHSSSHHESGTHHSSSHHDSGTHDDTCHSSGGGFDSGGGDTGGGCDSGGGDTGGGD